MPRLSPLSFIHRPLLGLRDHGQKKNLEKSCFPSNCPALLPGTAAKNYYYMHYGTATTVRNPLKQPLSSFSFFSLNCCALCHGVAKEIIQAVYVHDRPLGPRMNKNYCPESGSHWRRRGAQQNCRELTTRLHFSLWFLVVPHDHLISSRSHMSHRRTPIPPPFPFYMRLLRGKRAENLAQ